MNLNDTKRPASIDLVDVVKFLWLRKKVVIAIVGISVTLAVAITFFLPKQYESTALVQTRSAGKDIGDGAVAVAAAMGIDVGARNSSTSPLNYIELMKSRRVLDPIIDKMDWSDVNKKPTVKEFIQNYIKFVNMKQTNLITVTAKGRTPEEAQMISQGIVDNFLFMQTENSQQTQSLLVRFLNERIETTKNEVNDAAEKLATFQTTHKIYSPSEQVKLAIEQITVYDKTIGDLQVQAESAQIRYDVATKKLNEQKVGSINYNINDNLTVQSIRSQIVDKEVSLLGMRQKYTDKHPDVIALKEQLELLNRSLADEVEAVVNSNATSLNTAQMELLKEQAVAEAQIGVARVAKAVIQGKKEDKESEVSELPDDMVTYLRLESDAKIKQQVYAVLVQQYEENKIQEAMESMDIQIIDAADLPDEDDPVFPKKKIFVLIGLVVGGGLSLTYGVRCYRTL